MPYIGTNDAEKQEMLQEIGAGSIDELFLDIPESLLLKRDLNIESGYSEWELIKYFDKLSSSFQPKNSFKGAGCYLHHVPSLVKSLSSRGEFLTSYTPYQAEVSQGSLEAIYLFQSYISELTGMEIANASMYDGATALAESLTMAHRIDKKRTIYISNNIHPEYIEVTSNYLKNLDIKFNYFDSLEEVPENSIIAIQNPNFEGEIYSNEFLELLKQTIEAKNLFLVNVVTEAYALGLTAKASSYGAQIVCGSVQSFGNDSYYGGAQVGFISTLSKFVRQIPGRIVGKTIDRNNKEGFVLTFQAREQHIKRDRATSNICTNQSLHALSTAIHLTLLGEKGIKSNLKKSWLNAHLLANTIAKFRGLKVKNKNFFNEFTISLEESKLEKKELDSLKSYLEKSSVATKNSYIITVYETHSIEEIEEFINHIADCYKDTDQKQYKFEHKEIEELESKFNSLKLPEIKIANKSELEVCRYFTQLSQKNFSIDTNFYPLGSCTMKYNPKINDEIATRNNWAKLHPYDGIELIQGALSIYTELNQALCEITGFHQFSLQPSAGAHGELSALIMAKQYFKDQGQEERDIVLVPDSAHGTNPASASMAGFKTLSVKSNNHGDVDVDDLKSVIDKHKNRIAVFMLTNPSTFGLFETNILEIKNLIHEDGGLMYYDGANLNAIMGITRPGDMGFDLVHLNLHKSFSTPHGGGGPGAGPVGANKDLAPYLPSPSISKDENQNLIWSNNPKSIGRIRSFHGNFNVLIRALAYIKRNGKEGIKRIGETATLNANYLQAKIKNSKVLAEGKFQPFFKRICKHEFIISALEIKKEYGITALDIAKRLLDKGIHAPTIYFPTTIPEAIMIEPTETESKAELDRLINAFEEIITEIQNPESQAQIKLAPLGTEFSRFDEVKAVKEPILSQSMEKLSKESSKS